ncbi:MAG: hypothetical protein ORN85_02220, partial [Sediminibacterium sp.]|nr:hypothetical protein [Sediminibacterium sp.]
MINVFASTKQLLTVQNIINKEFRLNELVIILNYENKSVNIKVDDNITIMPDWENKQPPILISETSFNEDSLLGIIYAKLNNYEKAYQLLQNNSHTLEQIDLLNRIQNGIKILLDTIKENDAITLHNKAIAMQYGNCVEHFSESDIIKTYQQAIEKSRTNNQNIFTTYHQAQLYVDLSQFDEADKLLQNIMASQSDMLIENYCKDLQTKIWIKQIAIPYDSALINKVKDTLWQCLKYYEAENKNVEAAMILMDACYIATISNSFSESLGYINKAITVFETEQLNEMLAQAQFIKGNLLQTWGQNDNPQFYQSAAQAYQLALRVFTKENAPNMFAEIQHQLGKVYAEIPDEVKKKSVWASVAVSSFNEALNFFNKIDYPFEFSMICHSFGNAYTKFPVSLKTDNFDKALAWYREALDIRTVEKYPVERVLTLANYLEASWFVGNKEEFDEERYNDMLQVANEILSISKDEVILKNTKNE